MADGRKRPWAPKKQRSVATPPIPHLPSTNLPYAQESVGRAGGWSGGVVGVRRAGVGPAEGPLWAADGARGALEWSHCAHAKKSRAVEMHVVPCTVVFE